MRQCDCAWLILLGFGAALAVAIIHLNLVVPSYAEAKAIFGLSAIMALSACAARGWSVVARFPQWTRCMGAVALAIWALDVYGSFLVRGGSAATPARLCPGIIRQRKYN